jgi:hypothetical protein
MTEPLTLKFFRNEADLKQFLTVTTLAYAGALAAIQAGGYTLLDKGENEFENEPQGVLLGRAVVKMLTFKVDRAAQLATEGTSLVADADAELAKVWPLFELYLEQELEEARKMVEKMRAEGRGNLH